LEKQSGPRQQREDLQGLFAIFARVSAIWLPEPELFDQQVVQSVQAGLA
jgi:hypothetical protein